MAKISFGPFTLDLGRRRLTRDGEALALSPKAFTLLSLLLARRPDVVDKPTLMNTLWPDTAVLEANLNVLVSEIRAALGDRSHRYVETRHGVGFAFAADATDDAGAPPPRDGARFWLVANERSLTLHAGANTVGRDPHCQIWLDEAGISRQHARIHVDPASGRAELEDLGSTNGTFLADRPVSGRVPVSDGDVIRLGSRPVTFRAWLADRPKATEKIRRP